MDLHLQGKVALVTGASEGIGRACAFALAQEGAWVAVNYRSNKVGAEEVVAWIKEHTGSKAFAIQADVSDPEAVDAMIKSVLAQEGWSGRLDILVNNAGDVRDNFLMRTKIEDIMAVIGTNLLGTIFCCRAVQQVMFRQRWGRIVNISSVVGVRGNKFQAVYGASKGGVNSFTQSFALETADRGVTVNAIAPGWITTRMTERVPQQVKEDVLAHIPLKRYGTPDEVAQWVVFLCSDTPQAAYTTGRVFSAADGGIRI